VILSGHLQKKTILFIDSGVSGYGGGFQCLYQTIMVLGQRKYRFVVVFSNRTLFYEKLIKQGVECYNVSDVIFTKGTKLRKYLLGKLNGFIIKYLPKFSVWIEFLIHYFTIRTLNLIIKKEKVDLIHMNNQLVYNFVVLFAAKANGIPCVSHLRSFHSYGINEYKISFSEKLEIQYIAVSEKIKEHWTGKGINPQKIEVVYDIFFTPHNSPASPEVVSCLTDFDGYKIIYVGRLESYKGIPFLLDSFSLLLKENVKSRLFLVGTGNDEGEIRRKASVLEIEPYVFLFGYQKNPYSLMKLADLFVLPSSQDATPRVLLEAMDAGVPVIGTMVGGIPEIIEHGVNGLLVSYGDVDKLKRSIAELLNNNSLREKIIQGGYDTINSKFRVETYQDKLENIYDTLLGVAN
jgi:glycosyltransferase involved in cell wall biosynthesis